MPNALRLRNHGPFSGSFACSACAHPNHLLVYKLRSVLVRPVAASPRLERPRSSLPSERLALLACFPCTSSLCLPNSLPFGGAVVVVEAA